MGGIKSRRESTSLTSAFAVERQEASVFQLFLSAAFLLTDELPLLTVIVIKVYLDMLWFIRSYPQLRYLSDMNVLCVNADCAFSSRLSLLQH